MYYPDRMLPGAQVVGQGFVLYRGDDAAGSISTARIKNLGEEGRRQWLWVDGEGEYSWDSTTHGALPPLTSYAQGGILMQSTFVPGAVPWISEAGVTEAAVPVANGPSILVSNDQSVGFYAPSLSALPRSLLLSKGVPIECANNWAFCGIMWSVANGSNTTSTAYSYGGPSTNAQYTWTASSYWSTESLLFPGSGARQAFTSMSCIAFSPMASVGLAATVPRFPSEPSFMKAQLTQNAEGASPATLQLPQMLSSGFALKSYSIAVVATG